MSDLEQLARQCAEKIKRLESVTPELQAAAEQILAITKKPTMADVEWDGDEHWLAGATLPNGVEVVMLRHDNGSSCIDTNQGYYSRGYLTPNGKRYELCEVGSQEETEHTAMLVTEQDYENAPEGTIVARGDHAPYVKRGPNAWTTEYSSLAYDKDMARAPRKVLRWRWDE